MIAVIFEVQVKKGMTSEYLRLAGDIESELDRIDGFISIERFSSVDESSNKILSLSYWENKEAISEWTNNRKHNIADTMGRNELFENSVVRMVEIV